MGCGDGNGAGVELGLERTRVNSVGMLEPCAGMLCWPWAESAAIEGRGDSTVRSEGHSGSAPLEMRIFRNIGCLY